MFCCCFVCNNHCSLWYCNKDENFNALPLYVNNKKDQNVKKIRLKIK